jgi:hypothetical protein
MISIAVISSSQSHPAATGLCVRNDERDTG